jgi:hypothetical protein
MPWKQGSPRRATCSVVPLEVRCCCS